MNQVCDRAAGKTEFSTQREENRCTSAAAVRFAEEYLCGETSAANPLFSRYLGFSNFAPQVENQLEQLQNPQNTNEE